jgi:hypothetical protein
LNRIYQVSNPSESGTAANTATLYDVLNRVVQVTTPDGDLTTSPYSTSGTYDQSVVTDPGGNVRTLYYDALGRLVQVIANGPASVGGQSCSTSDYTTTYTYDVLDDLTYVTISQATNTALVLTVATASSLAWVTIAVK